MIIKMAVNQSFTDSNKYIKLNAKFYKKLKKIKNLFSFS